MSNKIANLSQNPDAYKVSETDPNAPLADRKIELDGRIYQISSVGMLTICDVTYLSAFDVDNNDNVIHLVYNSCKNAFIVDAFHTNISPDKKGVPLDCKFVI
jgi:hypothetical protein